MQLYVFLSRAIISNGLTNSAPNQKSVKKMSKIHQKSWSGGNGSKLCKRFLGELRKEKSKTLQHCFLNAECKKWLCGLVKKETKMKVGERDNAKGVSQYPYRRSPGADPGEVKWGNFHPPFSEPPPPFFFFSYPSNIEIIFDFSDFSD